MKMPQNGTKIMYSPVINPVFAELCVACMPSCCKVVAAKRITPQTAPPPSVRRSFAASRPSRSKIRITGTSDSAPMAYRIALNQNAPSAFPP